MSERQLVAVDKIGGHRFCWEVLPLRGIAFSHPHHHNPRDGEHYWAEVELGDPIGDCASTNPSQRLVQCTEVIFAAVLSSNPDSEIWFVV